MPASAYGLLALFTGVSAVAGWSAAVVVGPRRAWAGVLPALAAFAALYLVGHRLAMRVGPQTTVFGWEVSLLFDVTVAAGAALAAALTQRLGIDLLQPQQRRPGRDRLT